MSQDMDVDVTEKAEQPGDGLPDLSGRNRVAASIYLDNQATTRTDPRVLEAMLPYFSEKFGNPHSADHAYGWDAEDAVEQARAQVAELIGAEAREVIFTSGATEANNLAIKGAARFHKDRKPHVVTCVTEHKCVLESARRLEREGHRVTFLPARPDGLIDLDALADAVDEETSVVSIMAANNEIGVLQPIDEIAAICREKGAYFHCDAAQAIGKIPLDLRQTAIDLLSISAHKVYGPMGIGALFVRRRPRVRLEAELDGGGQERGLRSGTLPAPLCVGFGEAARIAREELAEESARVGALTAKLYGALCEALPGVHLNGHARQRLSGNLNLSFEGVEAPDLMRAVPQLCLSTGSACTSASVEPSYVLQALGVDADLARGSLRIGVGRFNTAAEIETATQMLVDAVRKIRAQG